MKAVPAAALIVFLATLFVPDPAHAASRAATIADLNGLWVLVAATLVFLMQAGFGAFEASCVPSKDIFSIAHKNFFDWVIVSLAYLLVGFGLHYGATQGGWFGSRLFGLAGLGSEKFAVGSFAFFFYQLVFAGTCATIVSGATTGRTSLLSHFAIAGAIGLVIYPVFGHWVWHSDGILARWGYRDFAGSSVVHLMGATVSFVGVKMVGPRLGRFDAEGKPTEQESYPTAPVWAMLGTIILWFGWIGFNGGSTLEAGDWTAKTIVVTNVAGAAGGLAAFLHCYLFEGRKDLLGKSLGGALGGLVAITASAGWTGPLPAIVIGALAGVLHNLSARWLLKWQLDDPVNAIPVHGACGILGLVLFPLFGDGRYIAAGSRLSQLGVQLGGVAACIAWGAAASFVAWALIRKIIGLRVSPAMEMAGINFADEDPHKHHEAQAAGLDEELLRKLAGGGSEEGR